MLWQLETCRRGDTNAVATSAVMLMLYDPTAACSINGHSNARQCSRSERALSNGAHKSGCCLCFTVWVVCTAVYCHSVVSQVATRMVTFSMNLLIARQLSPEAYGVSMLFAECQAACQRAQWHSCPATCNCWQCVQLLHLQQRLGDLQIARQLASKAYRQPRRQLGAALTTPRQPHAYTLT